MIVSRANIPWKHRQRHTLMVTYEINGMTTEEIDAFNRDLKRWAVRLTQQFQRQKRYHVEVTVRE